MNLNLKIISSVTSPKPPSLWSWIIVLVGRASTYPGSTCKSQNDLYLNTKFVENGVDFIKNVSFFFGGICARSIFECFIVETPLLKLSPRTKSVWSYPIWMWKAFHRWNVYKHKLTKFRIIWKQCKLAAIISVSIRKALKYAFFVRFKPFLCALHAYVIKTTEGL